MLHPAYDAPLPLAFLQSPSFGLMLSPLYLPRRITRPVSYYATLLNVWLLLSNILLFSQLPIVSTLSIKFGTLAVGPGLFPF